MLLPLFGERARELRLVYANGGSEVEVKEAKNAFWKKGLDVVSNQHLPYPFPLAGDADRSYRTYLRY